MHDPIRRRPLLQAMLGAGAAALVPGAATPAVAAGATATTPGAPAGGGGRRMLNPSVGEDLALIFRKLAYSHDGELGFWHLTATRHGLIGAELVPLWQMNIGRFFTVQDRPGGSYAVTQMGIAFYTDLESGEFLRKFRNPLNGKTVPMPYARPSVGRFAPPKLMKADYEVTAAMGSQAPNTQMQVPDLIETGALGPGWIVGEHVWVQQDHLLITPPGDPGAARRRVNDLTTYFGALRDVADPAVPMPPAGHAFTDINDWPAFLEMQGQPGTYYSRGMGFKAFSFDEMPEIWRRLMRQEYPEIARNPRKALES
jgi:hypothetical protein